jgi:hypothetical protein
MVPLCLTLQVQAQLTIAGPGSFARDNVASRAGPGDSEWEQTWERLSTRDSEWTYGVGVDAFLRDPLSFTLAQQWRLAMG